MDTNTTSNGSGGIASSADSLMSNTHVKELFSILQENGKDTAGLTALINHVSGMEDFVKQAETQIANMKNQIDTMKEVQDHPIKTALQNAVKTLEAKVAEIKQNIAELKTNIVEGCKNAVEQFKEKGAAALDKLASFFKVKSGLQAIKNDAVFSAKLNDKSMEKIESFSQEYQKASRAVKNLARIAVGKKPIDAVKASGKLAKVMSAPYKASKAINVAIGKQADKMIASLDKLEKGVEAKRGEQAVKPKKPTLMERLEAKKKEIKEREAEAPKVERGAKKQGLEV